MLDHHRLYPRYLAILRQLVAAETLDGVHSRGEDVPIRRKVASAGFENIDVEGKRRKHRLSESANFPSHNKVPDPVQVQQAQNREQQLRLMCRSRTDAQRPAGPTFRPHRTNKRSVHYATRYSAGSGDDRCVWRAWLIEFERTRSLRRSPVSGCPDPLSPPDVGATARFWTGSLPTAG
jgi:hypothetical protein